MLVVGEAKDKINTQQTVKRQLLGGWTKADITPEVKKALNFDARLPQPAN